MHLSISVTYPVSHLRVPGSVVGPVAERGAPWSPGRRDAVDSARLATQKFGGADGRVLSSRRL